MSRLSPSLNAQLRCEPLEVRYLLAGDFLTDLLPVPDDSVAEQVLTDLIDQKDWAPGWWSHGWGSGNESSGSEASTAPANDWQEGEVDEPYIGSEGVGSTETTGYPNGGWSGQGDYADLGYSHPSDIWLPFEGTKSGVTLVEPRFGEDSSDESLTAIRSARDSEVPAIAELDLVRLADSLAAGVTLSGSSEERFSGLLGDEEELLASLAGTQALDLLGATSAEEMVTVFDLEADPTLAPIVEGEELAAEDWAAQDSVAERLGPDLISILTQSTDVDDAATRLAKFFDELIEATYQFGAETPMPTIEPASDEGDLPRFQAEGSLGATQERDRTPVDIVHATAHAAALLAGLSLVLQSREAAPVCERPVSRDDS